MSTTQKAGGYPAFLAHIPATTLPELGRSFPEALTFALWAGYLLEFRKDVTKFRNRPALLLETCVFSLTHCYIRVCYANSASRTSGRPAVATKKTVAAPCFRLICDLIAMVAAAAKRYEGDGPRFWAVIGCRARNAGSIQGPDRT